LENGQSTLTAARTTLFFYIFEVYNIEGWSTDGGKKLKDEEKGCGALTGWDWDERTSTQFSRAYFNLPFIMKAGCVERAIVSAGGPKLSCKYQGSASILNGKRSMKIDPPARALPLRRQLISETASLPSFSPITES
jgi:chitinase